MNKQENRKIKALFESVYEPTTSADDFVRATIDRRNAQRRRRITLALAAVALMSIVTVANLKPPTSAPTSTEIWAAGLTDFYDEYDEYQTSLLEEPEGLDELPTETYAYIQLIEDQFEEN